MVLSFGVKLRIVLTERWFFVLGVKLRIVLTERWFFVLGVKLRRSDDSLNKANNVT
jgi:hypothetical protein